LVGVLAAAARWVGANGWTLLVEEVVVVVRAALLLDAGVVIEVGLATA
jgi:hypothetical protein